MMIAKPPFPFEGYDLDSTQKTTSILPHLLWTAMAYTS